VETDTIYLQASTLVVEFELIALGPKGGSIMPGVFIAVDTAQRQSPALRPFIGKNITNSTDGLDERASISTAQQFTERPHIHINAPSDRAMLTPQACEQLSSRDYPPRVPQKIF
jgi:hypothetical protein